MVKHSCTILGKKAVKADKPARFLLGSTCDGNFSPERCNDDMHMHDDPSWKCDDYFSDDEFNNNQPGDVAEERRLVYWESQEFLLQEILDHCNATGSQLREQIRRQINIAKSDSNFCNCLDKSLRGCIKCLRKSVVNKLRCNGFAVAICTSKWPKTHKIPGGTHEYIEVIASTQGRRKRIPYVVELSFLDEFRMAKACIEYNRFISQLPEIYIGNSMHLNAIIRVVCEAAKKSTDEQKIHMGPWRKTSFMQMKWSASSVSIRTVDHSSNELRISSSNAVASRSQHPAGTRVIVA